MNPPRPERLKDRYPAIRSKAGAANYAEWMKSRVHPTYKTKYRVGNWPEYERALVQRGDITLWLSAGATDAWTPSPSGRRGAARKFSDLAIETALTLRLVFGLPLRQAEGFLRSVLSVMRVDLEASDHTTLSRRSQDLAIACHARREPPWCPRTKKGSEIYRDIPGYTEICRDIVGWAPGVSAQ